MGKHKQADLIMECNITITRINLIKDELHMLHIYSFIIYHDLIYGIPVKHIVGLHVIQISLHSNNFTMCFYKIYVLYKLLLSLKQFLLYYP